MLYWTCGRLSCVPQGVSVSNLATYPTVTRHRDLSARAGREPPISGVELAAALGCIELVLLLVYNVAAVHLIAGGVDAALIAPIAAAGSSPSAVASLYLFPLRRCLSSFTLATHLPSLYKDTPALDTHHLTVI